MTTRTSSPSNFMGIECKMLVQRAQEVCMCVTSAIFMKLTLFIVEDPIICLLWNFTGYLRYTRATILLDKQFLKPKVYAASAFKVCTCKSVIFDYLLFTVCSSVSDEISIHAIAIIWLQQMKHNRQLENCAPAPVTLRGPEFRPPLGVLSLHLGPGKGPRSSYKHKSIRNIIQQ